MNTKKRSYHTWMIIALSFLMVFTVLGFCSSSKSLYTVAVCDALKISRSAYSFNDSCRYITTSVVSIFFGSLISRFGIKKMIMAGFGSLIISSFLYSVATNIWVIYLGGVFLGLGIAWTTTSMVGAITNKYCKKNRGTITGMILASNGLGGALSTQVLSPMIYDETNAFGYQNAYRLVCVILVIVALIILFLFQEHEQEERKDIQEQEKKTNANIWSGVAYNDAIKKGYFYGNLVCVFITGIVLQGMTGIAAPHLKDVGLSVGFVAGVLSIHSIMLTVSKFLTGFLYDHFGIRVTSNICLVTSIVIMFLLAGVSDSPTGRICACLYAIFSTIALPLETVMIPIYVSEFFGERSNNKILGIFVAVNTAGFAVGAPIANFCFDTFGSYNIALYVSGGLMILVTIGMQFVTNAAKRQRKLIEN